MSEVSLEELDVRLAELEALYRETKNPVFCWEAIVTCGDSSPLPSWTRRYLLSAARRLGQIDPDPQSLTGEILDALELSTSGGGPGPHRRARTAQRRLAALEQVMANISDGFLVGEAVVLAAAEHGYSPTTLRAYYFENNRNK